MKLLDTIIFSLAVASFIIGVHQIITVGLAQSYWLIMISFGLLLLFKMRKEKNPPDQESQIKSRKKRKK